MANESRIPWIRAIRTKIITAIIVTTTLVLAAAGYFFYRYTETTKTQELEQLAKIISIRLSQHIELPMWDLQYEQVGKLLEAEMEEAKIVGITVRDEDKTTLFAARERAPDGTAIKSSGNVVGDYLFASRDVLRGDQVLGNVSVFVTSSFLRQELIEFARGVSAVVVLLDIVILILVSVVLNRVVINPVKALATHAERISRGDFNQEIEARSHDEIGYLALTLNRMQLSLRVVINRLAQR